MGRPYGGPDRYDSRLPLVARGVVDQGDEHQIFPACVLQPVGSAVGAERHVTCLHRQRLVLVGVFPFALQQIVGLVISQMLMDGDGTAWMQGDPGKQVIGAIEVFGIQQDFFFDGTGLRILHHLFFSRRENCHGNLLLSILYGYYSHFPVPLQKSSPISRPFSL